MVRRLSRPSSKVGMRMPVGLPRIQSMRPSITPNRAAPNRVVGQPAKTSKVVKHPLVLGVGLPKSFLSPAHEVESILQTDFRRSLRTNTSNGTRRRGRSERVFSVKEPHCVNKTETIDLLNQTSNITEKRRSRSNAKMTPLSRSSGFDRDEADTATESRPCRTTGTPRSDITTARRS